MALDAILARIKQRGNTAEHTKLPTLKAMCSRKELADWIKLQTDTVLLAFSRGKDSLAVWVVLKEMGFKVVPFHMEMVPGLSFVEESLQYYEDHFKTPIMRVLHPSFFYTLNTHVAQVPATSRMIECLNLPQFSYKAVNRGVASKAGLHEDLFWCAVGVRAADSPIRRNYLSRKPPYNAVTRAFYPIYDFVKDDIVATLRRGKVKLPIDYQVWGRSWDGLDYRYLTPLRREFPEDYKRLLGFYPALGDITQLRMEVAKRHGLIQK